MTSTKQNPEPMQETVFIFPASSAQQRLWFIEQLFPGKALYVIPLIFRLTGSLHRSHLHHSLQAIVARHEILRTTFDQIEGQLVQVVTPELPVAFQAIDLQEIPSDSREETALQQIWQEIQQPFDLATGPLFRVRLWQLQDTEHLLLMALHHIIFDEWSSGILIQELGERYTALVENRPAPSSELTIQYADFAHWQQQWLQGGVFKTQLSYWRQQLKDVPALNLPRLSNGSRNPASQTYQGASQLIELPQSLLDAVEELSQQAGSTLFMTLLAAFQTLLHRYSGQTDIAIGSPIANRHRSELEGLIGFLVNSLVLRTDLAGDPTFYELLERVRDTTLAAYANQDLPFEKLVEELQPIRSLNQNPLFQAVFALQNTPIEQLALPGLVLSPVELETRTARFDLEVYVWKCADNFRNLWGKGWQQTDGLRGVIVYNTDMFDPSTIASLRQHFQTLLESIVQNPSARLSELSLLTPADQIKQLQQWQQNPSPYPREAAIHQLFELQVSHRPAAVAIHYGEQSFTYQQLNQGSNQLARYLQKQGICPGMRIGICLGQSVEAIAAMLAILKTGGAYVPLDPSHPPERLQWILEDAEIAVVLTQPDWAHQLQTEQTQVICLEQTWDTIAQESDENLESPCQLGGEALAYVIYTSGSTGTPKGVAVPHRAVNRLVCQTDYVQITAGDRVAQAANLAFDAATFEVWGALLNGAQLMGIERETVLSPTEFVATLQQQQISTLFLTTALFNQIASQIPTAFQSLKYLLFGGEAVNVDRVRSVMQQGKPQHLIHVYGPTENTTFSTWYELETITEEAATVPIGQAIANTHVYLLDANLKPIPAHAVGEIYLAGEGLAQGYFNRPELTAEKFVPNPYSPLSTSRLYKTGDRALYRADGNLEFLGRTDYQIKVRGFRVEPGEIEHAIVQHPAVQAAVVVVQEIDRDRQLIAYLVSESVNLPTERELRSFLKTKLPAYMLPAAFVQLEKLPLTANGKVDQKALPAPTSTSNRTMTEETISIAAPTTSLEVSLAELWAQILGKKQIGVQDNFFERGGHSLLATQLVSRIRDRFQVELPLRSIFEAPTISEIAQKIEALGWSEKSDEQKPEAKEGSADAMDIKEESHHSPSSPDSFISFAKERLQAGLLSSESSIASVSTSHSNFPLSFAQQRLWFLYQLAPDSPFYNVPAAIRLTGNLNHTALERSFQTIVRRHAALRTTFAILEDQPVQVVAPDQEIHLSVVDLQSIAKEDRERVSQQIAMAEAQRPFNLTIDPLLRVTLLQFAPTDARLLLTMHHIVADGWSLGVLVRELACSYTAFVAGQSPNLPPLPIQYTDFACWQRNHLQGAVLEEQLAYWRQQLQNLPELELPHDRPRPPVQSYRGATCPLQVSPALTHALETLSQQSNVSLFMTLLAAFQLLLHRYTGQEDIVIGSPIANRHHSELEGLIGFFVNSLVLRSDLSGNPTFRELLERVRRVALEAYEHQDLPFEKLVEELDPDRTPNRNPLFQVAFALQNAPMQPLELPGLKLEPVPLESASTRFDLEMHLWEPTHGLRSLWQSEAGLSGFISYSTDLFDRDRIDRLIGHFQTLLAGIVANPDARLSELPLLTSAERQQILFEWNDFVPDSPRNRSGLPGKGFAEAPSDVCFHQMVERWARSTPDAVAVVAEAGPLTYQELDHQSNRLAQALQQLGVCENSLVGLCVDRSAAAVIGILGILKAGGVYVPLDPNYPRDRLQFILTDTQVAILLTQSWLTDRLPQSTAKTIYLDHPLYPMDTSIDHNASHKNINSVTQDSLAYVIYTSGSTGIPKGVLLPHGGLSNVIKAQQQVFFPSRNSRILQLSSLSFDASIFEMALALGSGGTLYIPPESQRLPGMALVQFLKDHAITHALIMPSVLAVLPFAPLPDLQVLITGGEACSSQVIDRWAVDRHFFNAYGPTEATIWATVAKLKPGDHPQTIGHPILNTQVYLLDDHLNPVPAGISGELYIGGAGVARGYLNRPELTTEKFIPNPFAESADSEALLYRTGDRARYRRDGAIEFLGRIDSQIKIRGFRVELGEIEATLRQHPAIQDAVVIASEETSRFMRLSAYFRLDPSTTGTRAGQASQSSIQELQTQQVQQWQTLYDQTYYSSTEKTGEGIQPEEQVASSSEFNTIGWNSSYTGEPISPDQMQEWVHDRVQQIRALKPRRVLEIGCGTGLLLFKIAPHCQSYVGTDFSAAALQSVQNHLRLPHVKLLHRLANDFKEIQPASFDVVILNSIVQYFPDVNYLLAVLEGAIQSLAPGGFVFIGDVRSLPLLNAFHAWMRFCRAEDGMERSQLQQQAARSQFEEPEMAIDPAFFHALRDRFPQIERVQIRLSRGRSQNEMTQFRYNVLLHLQNPQNPPAAHTPAASLHRYDWEAEAITPETLQSHLTTTKPENVLITNVPNRRVNPAVRVANWLHRQTAPKTVRPMREGLRSTEGGIDPEDWWNLETVLPYRVEITWSSQTQTGNYDVLLIRQGTDAEVDFPVVQPRNQPWEQYANNPLQFRIAQQLVPELRHYLKKHLPDYMVPSVFVPLEALPLTPSGKVDRQAITQLSSARSNETRTLSNPAAVTEDNQNIALRSTEATLIHIWKELLQVQQVNLHDNFFELGGHSLLATQMTSRVRDALGLELPLQSVFEAPTIAQLAPILEQLREAASAPTISPLVRLDREAYRHQRLAHSGNGFSKQISKSPTPTLEIPQAAAIHRPEFLANPAALADRSPLVPLTLGDNSEPFFCVHPMFGVVFPYLELAHHLDILAKQSSQPNRSFYGLQPLGLDGKSRPLDRMEAIAAYYVQAIQTLQPQGPYFLGGWSFGGLVAFEMAQQLTQAGHRVALLAILDTIAPCTQPSVSQSLKFLLNTALWSTLPFLLDYGTLAIHQLQSWQPWLSRRQWSTRISETALRALVRQIPEESRLRLLDESALLTLVRIVYANAQAVHRYVPQPYLQRLTLFRATEQPEVSGHDRTLGWGTLAKDIQLHPVPGNHLSLLKPPHVQTLAQQLSECLIEPKMM